MKGKEKIENKKVSELKPLGSEKQKLYIEIEESTDEQTVIRSVCPYCGNVNLQFGEFLIGNDSSFQMPCAKCSEFYIVRFEKGYSDFLTKSERSSIKKDEFQFGNLKPIKGAKNIFTFKVEDIEEDGEDNYLIKVPDEFAKQNKLEAGKEYNCEINIV
jgi:hypothetical protein